uniref:FHA domain-containing protein n=1 Tax=Meloidogyne incognita TaxID=6306 RepID=A0A914L7U3_MELIC
MLRRGSSNNKKVDENILLLQNTLIGSDPNCDIVIKCSGVRPKHAVIEYSQKTSFFWLRQLIPSFNGEQGEHKRSSPENENKIEEAVNGEKILYDGSLIELRPLDKLRFGNGPESVEFTFTMPKISNKGGEKRQKCKRSSSSIGYSSLKKRTSPEHSQFSLPIVGKHIQPKPYVDRFARPVQSNVRLCQLQQQQNNKNKQIQNGTTTLRRSASASRIIAINSRNSNSTEGGNETDRKDIEATSERENKRKLEQNLQENQSEKQKNEILQNNLIREALNQENIRNGIDNEEEEEINSENNTIKNNRFEDSENSFQEALARAHEENERLREELLKNDFDSNKKKGRKKVFSSVNEIVFETFFKVCNEEMEILNRRLVNMSVRDYSDVFAEINKILHEPFSFRLMEINSKCSVLFESLKLESSEKEELYIQLDRFLKEKIYPISKAVDSFLGTLRESALIAKESARACSVFSQWSREFGDQLQLHPNWNLMLYKVRDLQNRFREQGLPRHWLPPSLMPLLEVLIFERKNWADEGHKKEHELTESLKEANEKIKRLEAELEKRILNGPQNSADPLQKINRIIQKDSKERANSIPLIRLPVSNDSSSPTKNSDEFDLPLGQRSPRGEKKQSPRSPRKPLISPRTPRSARSSRGSFRLASGASEEYESSQQHSPHQEAHVDSPHTPPPSYRVRSVLGARPLPTLELRALMEAAKVAKENQDNEEDETPWGDKIPEPVDEKKKSENIEETIDVDNIENQEVTKNDLSVLAEETPNGGNEMMEMPRESLNKNTENGDEHRETFENNGTLLESDKTTPLRDSTKILTENDDLENKNGEHDDQEEFEKIEKEILFQTKNENNGSTILNKEKQDNKKESSVLIPSKATRYKTSEFWGFAHSLANILNIELPSREAINYQFYNSLSRPQSADEFDARLKAVDSIQEKLKLVMNEVKKGKSD